MKISGFTMGKNVGKLYYPIAESIRSILPIVDEFVVALGDSDSDDDTRERIEAIGDPKIRIIDTVWNLKKYPNGTENAHQTDIAKEQCTGDWLFYLQADEVVHERYHKPIVDRCQQLLKNYSVEGLLFNYRHFWGDYNHYHDSHAWYPHEIRIVRNHPDIHSWESAQSFRRIPDFDNKNYRQQENTYKLKVASVDAYIYHYGWVRPPKFMQNKRKALETIHKGEKQVGELYNTQSDGFDYGPLRLAKKHNDTHPAVMREWIDKFDWDNQLRQAGSIPISRPPMKHERPKYRFISWVEDTFNGGKQLGGFKNYHLLDL